MSSVFGKRIDGGFRPEYAITSHRIDSPLLSEQNYVKIANRCVHFFGGKS